MRWISTRAALVAGLATTLAASACGEGGFFLRGREGGDGEAGAEAVARRRVQLGVREETPGRLTFRLYSSRAERVELWLYAEAAGAPPSARLELVRGLDGVWSTEVDWSRVRDEFGIAGALYYGYRAWGPNWSYQPDWTAGSEVGFHSDVDGEGNRFNPNKLLIDPYARELSHDPTHAGQPDATLYASGPTYRALDSGPVAPKGIVLSDVPAEVGQRVERALKDDIVYEVHVRGLTKSDLSVPPELRGTYRGAGMKATELAALGITAVELLPVQEANNDRNDIEADNAVDDNYWGYVTLGYFAPDRRYAADKSPGGPTREFQAMVKAFHDAGIKVLIDVVYNHTGEGGVWKGKDPRVYNILSWRGLDNPTYYCLTQDRQASWDNTGVGGNYNTFHPVAQDLIVDSLIYWRDVLGIDGFRFDLASVLGNTCEHGCFNYDKMNPNNALNRIARELGPRRANGGPGVDLIAEPWAIGGNSYQVGGFPSGWAEWNGIYRDVLRRDLNKLGVEPVTPGQLATRLAGSSDLYGDDGRKPWHSVNFVVSHDGFTLRDLFAFDLKRNEQPWPFGPSDGGEDYNLSWDQASVPADQRKAARNAFALLMLSAGTPMITGGDEFLRTQFGNNNAYNLDSEKNWLDYRLSAEQLTFQTFARRLLAFRQAHPALRPLSFYGGGDSNGNQLPQLSWFTASGQVPDAAFWNDAGQHALAWRLDGTELEDPAAALYVAYNGWSGPVSFTLPSPGAGRAWYRVTDTCSWAEGPEQVRAPGSEDLIGGEGTGYRVCGRGLLLLVAR